MANKKGSKENSQTETKQKKSCCNHFQKNLLSTDKIEENEECLDIEFNQKNGSSCKKTSSTFSSLTPSPYYIGQGPDEDDDDDDDGEDYDEDEDDDEDYDEDEDDDEDYDDDDEDDDEDENDDDEDDEEEASTKKSSNKTSSKPSKAGKMRKTSCQQTHQKNRNKV